MMDYESSEHLLEQLPLTEEEARVLGEYIDDYDFSSIEKQGPEWIFPFLKVIRAELGSEEMILEDYELLNNIFIHILEWLLEGSDYLKCFEGVKLNDARMQIERYLDEAVACRKATRLIDEKKEDEYVISKLEKLTLSGYLYKKSLVWITLLTIVRWSPRLYQLSARGWVLLLYHTLNKPVQRVMTCFQEQVDFIRKQDEVLSFEGHTREQLTDAIWMLGARILMGGVEQEELTCLRSMFFRYLYVLHDKQEEVFRKNAFNSLLFNQKNALFTWEELLTFSIPVLRESVITKTVDAVRNCQGRFFERHGQLLVETKAITLAAPVSLKFDTLMEIDGVALKLGYSRKKLSFEEELAGMTQAWRSVFADFSDEWRKNVVQKGCPPVGAEVNIRVQQVYASKPTLVFVTIVDPRYSGQGVLHVSQVTRARLDSLQDVFHPGDMMPAKVIESEGDRLQFSIWEELNQVAVTHLQVGDQCNALFLSEKNGFRSWLSEQGFFVSTSVEDGESEVKSGYYLLEITDVPSMGRIKGKVLGASHERFDRHEAVAHLVYSYIHECKKYKCDENRERCNAGKIERSVEISGKYVKELIRLLQLYLTREVCLENLNLLYFIRLLAHILGDGRLKGYYDCLINHLIIKYEFIEGCLGSLDLVALERDFRAYPALAPQWAVVKMLASYGDPAFIDELEHFAHSHDEYVAKVAKCILAEEQGNVEGETHWVGDELLELLSLKGKTGENLLQVDARGERTYYNSLVYSVGAEHVDVEAQLDGIMQDICRFLNGEGGAVYIGVSDKGIPVGIQADLDYLCCNPDKYELFLHQRIKEAFGEEVDDVIKIERKQLGDKVVVVLVVPHFDQVVEYHSEN